MSNRFQDEFPSLNWQATPQLGPDDMQVYARRARQARAEVTRQAIRSGAGWLAKGTRRLAAAIVPAARRLRVLLTCAGYGAAKRWPDAADCR